MGKIDETCARVAKATMGLGPWVTECLQTPNDVDHPAHYNQGGIECIDAIAVATVNLTGEEAFDTGCALKYLWRWKAKGGIEDLKKAKWYIDRIIEKETEGK